MWVHDLRDADTLDEARCGGKAAHLARLRRAGLTVPGGFVIEAGAFEQVVGEVSDDPDALGHALEAAAERIASAELPRELIDEVARRAAQLGARVMVRSSATIEDGAAGAAAGVFSSREAVPIAQVWDAIRAVWTSALTPLAAAYARRRGGKAAIAVIIQEFVEGERVTVYTRPPGKPDDDAMIVQRGTALERIARDSRGLAELGLRAERAIGAQHGADVEVIARELAGDVSHWAIVQARPIVHPQPRVLVAPPPAVLAPLDDGRVWTWDLAHNPDPLSLAQRGLVERVERAGVALDALRVCAGFLYSSPRDAQPAAPPLDRADEIFARAAAALDEAHPPATLDDALARYLAFYAIWARELGPLVAATPRAGGSRPSSIEATLLAAARGELDEAEVVERLGALAPAWDVAAPTYGERPAILRDAIARARAAPAVVAAPVDPAADLGERDDLLFARAQRLVRRALLARAAELGLADRDDIFWLPLDDVLATPPDPVDAHRRAAAERDAAARAARWNMPVRVGGAPAPQRSSTLRGVGTGPRVTGRVVRFATLASAIVVGAGDVVVTRAVTPALAVLVVGCAALISETGGLLDHGAALARELGIPCVVGCHDAWSELSDGMLVTVDGDAGVVTRT